MFEGPEYESYIALCRELRPEHIFGQADWAFVEDPESENGGVVTTRLVHEGERAGDTVVWLPRLDQWLATLEEAGGYVVRFTRIDKPTPAYAIDALLERQPQSEHARMVAPTREETAARLWMTVTRR